MFGAGFGAFLGIAAYIAIKILLGFYTIDPNERAVKVIFGRANRRNDAGGRDCLQKRGNESGQKFWY